MATTYPAGLAAAVTFFVILGPAVSMRMGGGHGQRVSLQDDHELRVAANNKFDHIFANMRQSIADSGLDPLPMESDEDFFTVTLFNRTMNGSIWVGDGAVRGLSTIHRSGNMTLEYGVLAEELIVSGEIGLTGLEVSYAAVADVGFMGSKFKFTFGFPFLSVLFKTNVFVNQADVQLEYCYIEDFSYSHMHIEGVGPKDEPFYELFINALLQILNDNVATGVEAVVCSLVEQAITGSAEF